MKALFFTITCVTWGIFVKSDHANIIELWQKFPLLIFQKNYSSSIIQPQCEKAYENFLKLLQNHDINALKMIDATAKIPSGILSGNINQYGDFNECMEVEMAQYCLAELDIEPLWQKSQLKKFKHLAHSYYLFRENFTDPAHRLPGFTMVRWGFCIPHECTSKDLTNSLEKIGMRAQIRPGMCQKATEKSKTWTFGDYFARTFFGVIIVFTSLAFYMELSGKTNSYENNLMKIVMCFSLRKNVKNFFSVKENQNEIAGLHCIRSLSALALLMSHKSVSLFFNPFINRTATIKRLSQPWTIIAKNAIIYTDCFMLLSGLLNTNALLTDLQKSQSMKFKDKLISRLFRIIPNLLAIILFCTYILPSMGSGPLWPTAIGHHSDLCKQHMWKNLFFIHNYFGFENMCLTHTHQLGIDMQLFILTPILVYFIWKNRKIGYYLLTVLGLASTLLRFFVSYQNDLTSVIYFGISISKMFQIANLSYILPTHRATVYLIGVYMACLLKFSKPTCSLSKTQLIGLWAIMLVAFLGSWFGPYHMVQPSYVYNKLEASLIAALYPIFWGAGVAFCIYIANKDIAGIFGYLLCWKYFQITTKIAYALYLVQFPVFFYNVGLTRHIDEYHPYYQLQVLETSAIIFCSLVLVLLVEMPFQNIKKVLFDYKEKPKKFYDNKNPDSTRKPKFG